MSANDDAIVAALTLLLDGTELERAKELLVRALMGRQYHNKYVCDLCGSEEVTWDSSCHWNKEQQAFITSNWEKCWCSVCDQETRDECVHVGWEKEPEGNDAAA